MEKEEKDVFMDKEDFFLFEQIAESAYVWNLIALIIAMIFCLFLFRIAWSEIGPHHLMDLLGLQSLHSTLEVTQFLLKVKLLLRIRYLLINIYQFSPWHL